jgi:hypothetical protein
VLKKAYNLKKDGCRLATLTNSPIQTLTAQFEHAVLTQYKAPGNDVKKITWIVAGAAISIAALMDPIRYLQPDAAYKQKVLPKYSFPASNVKEIILVYNADSGIYPGIVDFIKKEIFPSTYPCNLCYVTFGTFSIKDNWKHFLDSLPYQKKELHKDRYKRNYLPEDLPLPAILLSNGTDVEVLVSAQGINQQHSVQQMEKLVLNELHNSANALK